MKGILFSFLRLLTAAGFIVVAMPCGLALAETTSDRSNMFSSQLIAKGEILAGIGNCAACHTLQGGQSYAGGVPIVTPFGSIYSTNITSDRETGIGAWSQRTFTRAMRDGVRPDGSNFFPAFPYTHFAIVDDADLSALYAYLLTRPAITARPKPNSLPFPLNLRILQSTWKWLFFDKTAPAPDISKSDDWNRGRYLAEGLAHCGACHTPRNKLGAEIKRSAYLGAKSDNWFAPALNASNTAPLPWTESEVFLFLREGSTDLHGTAVGPMAQVVYAGLASAPDADIHALAVYFADVNGTASVTTSTTEMAATLGKIAQRSSEVAGLYNDHGATLYLGACASCHANSDGKQVRGRPELGLSGALSAPDPSILLQVILHGVKKGEGTPGVIMPGFAASFSDADVSQLAAYLRRSRTDLPPWNDLDSNVAVIRRQRQP